MIRVMAIPFARGGPGAVDEPHLRGSVFAASRLRSEQLDPFTPVLNPMACGVTGPHSCIASWDMSWGALVTADPARLAVFHYEEWLDRDRGRCQNRGRNCEVPDASMDWAVELLRSGL